MYMTKYEYISILLGSTFQKQPNLISYEMDKPSPMSPKWAMPLPSIFVIILLFTLGTRQLLNLRD